MKIDKTAQKVSIPSLRVYEANELEEFHKKIQKFNGPNRTLESGEVVRKFYWEEMAVAYGAMSRWYKRDRFPDSKKAWEMILNGEKFTYMSIAGEDKTCRRMTELNNLWNQYQKFMSKEDWKKEFAIKKQMEGYEQLVEESDIQDQLF